MVDIKPDIETPYGTTFGEGDDIKLICKTSMFDFEMLTWERGSSLDFLTHSVSSEKSGVMLTSILTIQRAQTSDKGVYLCKGWSKSASSESYQSVNISVKGTKKRAYMIRMKYIQQYVHCEVDRQCALVVGAGSHDHSYTLNHSAMTKWHPEMERAG